jgi:hypothetical protein
MLTLLPSMVLVASLVVADTTGTWAMHLDPDFGGQPADHTCTLKQEGQKLTGTCDENAPFEGEVHDRHVRWTMKVGLKHDLTVVFTADLDERGGSMAGSWELSDQKGKFTMNKQ